MTIKQRMIADANYDDMTLQPVKIENLEINLQNSYKRTHTIMMMLFK